MQNTVLTFAAILMCSGCSRTEPAAIPSEPSLATQANEVRSGKSDRVQVEQTALSDGDLRALSDLSNLRVLLLDHSDNAFSADGLAHLADLAKLEHLRIRGRILDDAAWTQISRLQSLQILNIPQTSITDAELAQLQRLPHLVQLRLGAPRLTDAAIRMLAELPSLKRLHLIDVPLTDVGIQRLAQMEQLESLYIDGGQFSDQAIDDLFRRRPQLHVHLNQQHHDRDPHKHDH